jgi:outer membrane protein assembly factor BamB
MLTAQIDGPTPRKPLRLWPGVVMAIVVVLARYVVPPLTAPDAEVFSFPLGLLAVLAGMLCAVAIVVWWMFFSRAPWLERLGAIILMIAGVFATRTIVHESIRGGMMGMMLVVYSIPPLSLALVVWAVVTRRLSDGARRASLVVAILLACAPWALVRTAGLMGSGSEFHWRWTKTPEQRLLAQTADEPKALPPSLPSAEIPKEPLDAARGGPRDSAPGTPAGLPAAAASAKTDPAVRVATEMPAEWPGFRGPGRDSRIRGVRINGDWSASPPVEMWRRPIGPGWSSFAVRGDLLYTQEQRGDDEIVACYRVSTGEPVWRHRDAVRFWESNAGAGPRATPTLSGGRVYTLGATGIVNALDATSGAVVWSRNAATDTARKVPDWGFASSPLVIDDLVIIAVAGQLVAYDVRTGHPRWFGSPEGGGYSSPHLMTIDGVAQILLLRGSRTTSVAPADGTILWEHAGEPSVSIVQPALAADGEVLVAIGDGMGASGMLRLAVGHGPGGWTVRERWTSRGLKPYFNDFVVHKGHAFGFDGSILACIDVADGNRKWKGGRYGQGQLVLLPDQDVLLVVSEEGELALVKATPEQFTQIARVPAIEGKTWNHPVLVGDVLLVRNGEEMAAFRLSLLGP